MRVTIGNARILKAAQEWAQQRQLDLGQLSQQQQQTAIAEVARITGVALGIVREALIAQWSALIEEQGRQLGQRGGAGAYRAGAQRRDLASNVAGFMLDGKVGANDVRAENSVRGQLDDGRIRKDDLDRLLTIVADGNPQLAPHDEARRRQLAKTSYIEWGGRFGRDQQWDALVRNAVHNAH